MTSDISLLDRIAIASPCTASWSAMKGDDKVRFCDQCSLHVYNLAAMSRDEAEQLIADTEGRLCARLYRRPDGTVLTRDCPVGLAAARRKLARGLTWIGAAAVASFAALFSAIGQPRVAVRLRDIQPFDRLCNWLAPPGVISVPITGAMIMGRSCLSVSPPIQNQGMRIQLGPNGKWTIDTSNGGTPTPSKKQLSP